MDLFDYMRENQMKKEAPLASRLRPGNLDEVVGQQHAQAGLERVPGARAGILWRQALQRLVPGDADGVDAVPQRPVQIKQQSVKQGRFLPS